MAAMSVLSQEFCLAKGQSDCHLPPRGSDVSNSVSILAIQTHALGGIQVYTEDRRYICHNSYQVCVRRSLLFINAPDPEIDVPGNKHVLDIVFLLLLK